MRMAYVRRGVQNRARLLHVFYPTCSVFVDYCVRHQLPKPVDHVRTLKPAIDRTGVGVEEEEKVRQAPDRSPHAAHDGRTGGRHRRNEAMVICRRMNPASGRSARL